MDWNLTQNTMGRIIMIIVQVEKIDGRSKLTFLYEVMANVNNVYKYLLVQFNIILYKLIYSTQTDMYKYYTMQYIVSQIF